MDILELFDETFDKDRTDVYELSIQVSLNGFSYAVKDTIRNTYVVLVSKPFSDVSNNPDSWGVKVNEIVAGYPFLTKRFKKICLAYTDSLFTLVPAAMFDADRAKLLFEQTQPLPEYSELHYTSVVNGSSYVVVFAMPYTLTAAWLKVQSATQFVNIPAALIHSASAVQGSSVLQADIIDERLVVVYHNDGQFLMANSFVVKGCEDVVYYILTLCKTLGVDAATAIVRLYGQSQLFDASYNLLMAYFPLLSPDARYHSTHFSYQLLRYRSKYFSLFNSLSVCE
ncbi:MAG: DUF3822 family protein [Bacteroidales bacterium]|nr:DUF3822 family protein [Bacteroidales bacterium]